MPSVGGADVAGRLPTSRPTCKSFATCATTAAVSAPHQPRELVAPVVVGKVLAPAVLVVKGTFVVVDPEIRSW